MTVTSTFVCVVVALGGLGCGSKSSDPAKDPPKTTEASKDPAKEPAKAVVGDQAKDPAKDPDKPAAGGGEVSCETALKNSYAIALSQGSELIKKANTDTPIEKSVESCKTQGWSAELRGCLNAAKTIDDVYYGCYKQALKGHDITIKRTISVKDADGLKTADPPLFTVDGDFFQVREGCGLLYADTGKGGAGMFLVCGGQTRGPMTTPDQVQEVFAKLSADMKAEHDTVMGIIANMPSGRFGGWKVCDQAGNCHIE